MPLVTIVGSNTPCVELPRGEFRTVQYTDHVQRLIDRGFVVLVEWHDDIPTPAYVPPSPEPEPVEEMTDDGGGSADPGKPDPEHLASEGSDAGGPVDSPGETPSG